MATIALLSTGLRGHAAPLARLGAVLSRQGHRLHAWVPEAFRSEFERVGVDVNPHEPVPAEAARDLFDFAARLASATELCAGELIEELHANGTELVLHDVHVPWGRVAADFLGLPRIVSTPLYPAAYEDPEAEPFAPGGRPDIAVRIGAARSEVGRRWGVELGTWRAILWNRGPATANFTTEEIAGRPDEPPSWTYIGPLMEPPIPRSRVVGRPYVYVSFGTFFHVPGDLIRAAIEALADQPLDALISTGRTAVAPEDLGPLPDNVEAREFVDTSEVLARADAFVTHAGGNSVHEGLMAGVPMVCVPLGADHFDWAHRIEELGAGTVASSKTAAIGNAVSTVLEDSAFRERAVELGARLAEFDGESRVGELVERLLAATRVA